MDDPVATDVDVEFDATPSEVLELNDEWVVYLESQPVPGAIEGVNPEIAYRPSTPDSGLA